MQPAHRARVISVSDATERRNKSEVVVVRAEKPTPTSPAAVAAVEPAQSKPVTVAEAEPQVTQAPLSTPAADQNISALMTNKNSPTVTTVTGKVRITSTGRSTALNRPMTNAAISAEPKLSNCTPL